MIESPCRYAGHCCYAAPSPPPSATTAPPLTICWPKPRRLVTALARTPTCAGQPSGRPTSRSTRSTSRSPSATPGPLSTPPAASTSRCGLPGDIAPEEIAGRPAVRQLLRDLITSAPPSIQRQAEDFARHLGVSRCPGPAACCPSSCAEPGPP